MIGFTLDGEKMTNESLDATFYPKKTTFIFGLILCSLCTIGAVVLAITQGWPGYFFAVVFVAGILITVIQLLPGCSYLRIDSEGFTICSLFRETRIPWSAVEEFRVIHIRPGAVGLNFVPSYENPIVKNKMFKKLTNCDFALPNNYGHNPEDLAAFMNECLLAAKSNSRTL